MSGKNFGGVLVIVALVLGVLYLSPADLLTPGVAADESQSVYHTRLIEFLPNAPPGWSRHVEEWSIAEGTYNLNANLTSKTIDAYVSISDHGGSFSVQEFWDRLLDPERNATTITVQGFQAVESEEDSRYFLRVNIHDRFFVSIYTNRDKATLYYFANVLDCNEIAAMEDSGSNAQGLQPVVRHTELREFLPDAPPGWEQNVDGLHVASGRYTVNTTTDFTTTDAYVGILDYGSTVSDQEFWDRLPEPDGETKEVTIKGFPAREEYVADVNYYILQVNLHNCLLVTIATPRDRETLYYFADSLNYNELAALAGTPADRKTPGFGFAMVVIALFGTAFIALNRRNHRYYR